MEDENKKKDVKNNKKKIVITIIIVVVVVALAVGGFIFYHGNQTSKLIAEVNKISNIEITNEDGTLKENPIDMEIKTTGSYAVVEETLKSYMNEIVTETQELIKSFDEDKMMNLVSIDNIKEDGPDFTKSKSEIKNMKETIDIYVSRIEEHTKEENILSRIDDKNVSQYYKELYKQLVIDEESGASMKSSVEELKTAQEEAKVVLSNLENVFNFLSENKDGWQIENDQIVFTTQSAYDEYENLLSTLETMQ